MGETTKIQWTDHTFNPWMGCAKVHAGCTNCYAVTQTPVRTNHIAWGEVWQGGQRHITSDTTWNLPLKWARKAALDGERRRVFCASLADVLEVPAIPPESLGQPAYSVAMHRVMAARHAMDEARARLWDAIRQTARMLPSGDPSLARTVERLPNRGLHFPGLDWLLLTKRPENWHLVPEDIRPLVWLGTSISDQQTADEWVPRLLAAQGFRYRFLSVEPLVGPVNLRLIRRDGRSSNTCPPWWVLRDALTGDVGTEAHGGPKVWHAPIDGRRQRLDWVIVGGESGNKARPCSAEWVRDIVRQCREASVPCFVKQLGAQPRSLPSYISRDGMTLQDDKGGNMAEWPEYLRVRELPRAK